VLAKPRLLGKRSEKIPGGPEDTTQQREARIADDAVAEQSRDRTDILGIAGVE
jgi:hypothetical protein